MADNNSTQRIPTSEDTLDKHDITMYRKGYVYKLIPQSSDDKIDPLYAKTVTDAVETIKYVKKYKFKPLNMSKIIN